MRHRSRSRNYDSNDNYKSRRSPAKYDSSRSHKNKTIHSHYSSESRKHESSKLKKSSDRSRYDNHRDHDSESDDKYDKKGDSNYDRDCKRSKFSKYSPAPKHSRKYDDYTHSYRRRSMSSEISNQSYDSKYKKYDDKSDSKKIYYKQTKDLKPSKQSRSPSSDQLSDSKVKLDFNKEKIKDKKLKKKSKKTDKDKEKKKRKRQKHSSEEDIRESDVKRNPVDKLNSSKSLKHPNNDDYVDNDDNDPKSKSKPKLEPFKVKETSNLKSQINFLNSSNIFTKDEWQKEASDDDGHKKQESKLELKPEGGSAIHKKIKSEPYEGEAVRKPIKTELVEDNSKEPLTRKPKSDEDKDKETDDRAERTRKKRHRNSRSRARDNPIRSSKHREPEDDGKSFSSKSVHDMNSRPTRSRSHNRPNDVGVSSRKEKQRRSSRDAHRKPQSGSATTSKGFSNDDSGGKKMPPKHTAIEDSFEDERIELPSTPTDAQYTGLFARLPEDPVSDTEVDEIVPPMLLDDRMKALLVNDPNVCQEAWDVEDDLLLSKRDSLVAPRHRGLLETLAVPWALLIDEATLNKPVANVVAKVSSVIKTDSNADDSGRGLARFTVVSRLVENLGLSRQLCNEALWTHVKRTCPDSIFLHPIAPVHQTLLSHRTRRNTIFSERGLFAGALSARKDLFIRRVLYEPIT